MWQHLLLLLSLSVSATAYGREWTPESVERFRAVECPSLFAEGEYETLMRESMSAFVAFPQFTQTAEQLFMWRAKAMLAAKKPDAARVEAIRCFNLARISYTDDAIALVSSMLEARDPQAAAAWRYSQLLDSWGVQTADPLRFLSNADLADDQLAHAVAEREGKNWYGALHQKGNLLLASGQAERAAAAFELAYSLAPDDYLMEVSESIARVRKAQTGGVGAANRWIDKLKAGG